MFRAMRAILSAARSGAGGRAGSSSRFLSGPSDSRRLAGKVAVITGAASGIGKVTAAEFVRNGARVVLADVQDDLGRAAAAELGGPGTACYTRCDVTDEAQVAAAVDLAVTRHGRLDVMFNNAGVTGGNYAGAPIESLDMADFDRVMAVNLRGVAAGIKHAAVREMLGLPPRGAGDGEEEEVLRRVFEEDFNEMGGGVVLRAEDVARAAVFLASDDARYITGHNLMVDGGFSVVKPLNLPAS